MAVAHRVLFPNLWRNTNHAAHLRLTTKTLAVARGTPRQEKSPTGSGGLDEQLDRGAFVAVDLNVNERRPADQVYA